MAMVMGRTRAIAVAKARAAAAYEVVSEQQSRAVSMLAKAAKQVAEAAGSEASRGPGEAAVAADSGAGDVARYCGLKC